MSMHRLARITVGVPNVAETDAYYREFGLGSTGDATLTTVDGGNQLQLVETPRRRLVAMEIGCDDPEDVARITASLNISGYSSAADGASVRATDPATGIRVTVGVMPRLAQHTVPQPSYNGPGRVTRAGRRAPGVVREGPVRPKKLGHAVVGTVDLAASTRFFTKGLGFKVSDAAGEHGIFLRCSTDHHNLMLLQMPVNFLHHTSWQVDDVDEIGRGATAMLEGHPERHVWGLGRHHAGSNFFWYLKDPAGNFSEYYSDMDSIPDDEVWTPEVLEGAKGLFSWGPPPPPSFLAPEDLASLMTNAHT